MYHNCNKKYNCGCESLTVRGCVIMKPALLLQRRCEVPCSKALAMKVLLASPSRYWGYLCSFRSQPKNLSPPVSYQSREPDQKELYMYCIQRERKDERVWGRGGGGTKKERHLIIYALSCERQQKSVRVWEKKKRRGERDLESDCVCVRETFLWPSASQKAPSD